MEAKAEINIKIISLIIFLIGHLTVDAQMMLRIVNAQMMKGQLHDCSPACPRHLNPVCASNGEGNFRLFSNDCQRRAHVCQTQKDWNTTHTSLCAYLMGPTLLQQCLQQCPYQFKPVCGRNEQNVRIFSNECIFDVENCFDNGKWSKVPDKNCIF